MNYKKYLILVIFIGTAYLPDPLPYIDELVLGGSLLKMDSKLFALALLIFGVTTLFGFPPIGLAL